MPGGPGKGPRSEVGTRGYCVTNRWRRRKSILDRPRRCNARWCRNWRCEVAGEIVRTATNGKPLQMRWQCIQPAHVLSVPWSHLQSLSALPKWSRRSPPNHFAVTSHGVIISPKALVYLQAYASIRLAMLFQARPERLDVLAVEASIWGCLDSSTGGFLWPPCGKGARVTDHSR
jgi:hypothetical protein